MSRSVEMIRGMIGFLSPAGSSLTSCCAFRRRAILYVRHRSDANDTQRVPLPAGFVKSVTSLRSLAGLATGAPSSTSQSAFGMEKDAPSFKKAL